MSVRKALNIFSADVIGGARKELQRQDKNSSKSLSKSLDFKVKVSKNSFQLDFFMEDYGKFIDKGVKGAGGVRKSTSKFKKTNNKGKLWKLKKVTNNLYKYGNSGGISPKHFTKWAKRKGLSEFAVAKAVYHQGLETTNFFTKPFEKEFKKLPEQLVEAFGLEVDKLLKLAVE